jgi:hypothetical protein
MHKKGNNVHKRQQGLALKVLPLRSCPNKVWLSQSLQTACWQVSFAYILGYILGLFCLHTRSLLTGASNYRARLIAASQCLQRLLHHIYPFPINFEQTIADLQTWGMRSVKRDLIQSQKGPT